MHILFDISRSKCNQTIKFRQLIEYNMKQIFLEKSYAKCGGETIPTPFSKQSKLEISLDHFVFTVSLAEGYRNVFKLNWRPLACTSLKAF